MIQYDVFHTVAKKPRRRSLLGSVLEVSSKSYRSIPSDNLRMTSQRNWRLYIRSLFYLSSIRITAALQTPVAFHKCSKSLNVQFKRRSSQLSAISSKTPSDRKVSVLICPAQFCVPADYESLITNLQKQHADIIGTCRVAPLPRTEWIKVAKQLPTKEYLDATLPCHRTLDWYFRAMETALGEIYAAEGDDTNICIIGHSIGGWVARAYLGGLSDTSSTSIYKLTQQQCTSFITLGAPHLSPSTALVDQTRGLLKEVENTVSCSPQSLVDRGIDVTCVGSSAVKGSIFSSNVENIIALTSYVPLLGIERGLKALGDGIIPTDLAFMEEPARRIELSACKSTGHAVRHAHVFPTPWNLVDGSAPSLSLPDTFLWYGAPTVMSQWSSYVR